MEPEVLAAVERILLNARIQQRSDTEVNWNRNNPVLLNGEIGFVSGSSPAKFKVGNGTVAWNLLPWGNITTLAQLTADTAHRLVTDTQISGWNAKARQIVFNHSSYSNSDAAVSNAQKQIVKDIVTAVNAGENIIVIAEDVTVPDSDIPLSGIFTIAGFTAGQVAGHVETFAAITDDGGETKSLVSTNIMFKPDGSVMIGKKVRISNLLTTSGLPVYSVAKVTTESGFASTYNFTKNGVKAGVSINIPLDQVLKSSSTKTVTTTNSPYAGAVVGDVYIEFLFQNNNTPQYLPAKAFVDNYTGSGYIRVSPDNIISVDYTGLKTALQTTFNNVYDAKGTGAAEAKKAVDELMSGFFIINGGSSII